MVNVSIDVTDLGGEARPGDKVVFWRPRMGGSATHAGRVISTAPVTVFLTDGKATVSDVEPGEMTVLLQCRGVESQGPVDVTVPDGTGTVTLRSLIEAQFEYAPPIVSAVQEAADNAAASERAAIQAQVRSENAADRADAKVDDAINNGANLIRAEVKQDADRAVAAKNDAQAAQSESSAATHAQNALTYAGQSEDARDESRLARDEAVQAAENAQQGAPSDGWKKSELSQPVQDSLSRADTALQSMPVATASAPGGIRLAGDLAGTSQAPTVPGLAGKADSVHTHTVEQVDGLDSELQALRNLIHARPAFFSGEGAPVNLPYAVVGDYYFDETTEELHKITGV